MTTMDVRVVSPEEEVFSGTAEFISAMTVEGSIGILPGHVPILAQLPSSEIKVVSEGQDRRFSIEGGFLTVKENKVIILAEPESGEPA